MTSASDIPAGLVRRLAELFPQLHIVDAKVLGADVEAGAHDDTSKGVGYGRPLKVSLEGEGQERVTVVLHVANADDFGHDRRADRAAAQVLAFDTFGLVPHHTRALDVGAVRADGSLLSLAGAGEFYLLTTWAEGEVYASDLRRVATTGAVTPLDLARLEALVSVMKALHQQPGSHAGAYTRALRDLVGSGEGIAGLVDGYPAGVPSAPAERLEALEQACLGWRQRLKARHQRLRRTHGDLHPFNIVFAPGDATPQLLDTSRGSEGDPADDVACLAVNFLFFGLSHAATWRQGLGVLWRRFWELATPDDELLEVLAPWLTWRLLVLANPVWYPNVTADERDRLLGLAERALTARRFDLGWADELMSATPTRHEVTEGVVVWFTGLPSSGKSTLARRTASALAPRTCVVLDGDELRECLVPTPGYDDASRADFYETLVRLAATLAKQGHVVLVAATAHRRAFRERARALSPRLLEVFVDTPLAECARRDAKGLYASQTAHLPGLQESFEAPLTAELTVRPADVSPERTVAELISASSSVPNRTP
ncbi:MAG: adenylyl-sulfate kinase [Myxococcales bacterium]|nr:adenylyl-sulfate kinase [Myxococcales bacterium]